MQRREKMMVIVTAVIVGALLLYQFVLADWLESGGSLAATGELAQVRQDMLDYKKILEDRAAINSEYASLAMASEAAKGTTPEDIFNKDLYNLLTEKFHLATPRMEPARQEVIPNVDDYYFITIRVNELSGPPRQMLELLRNLEAMGLIITSFKIERVGERDAGLVRMDFEVARLVKHTEQSRKRMSHLRRNRS